MLFRLLAVFYNALPVRWQRRILDRTQARFLVGVVGLGVDPNGHVILARHRFGAPEWRFLGGFLSARERLEDALAREVREETGVEIEVGPILEANQGYRWQRVEIVYAYRPIGGLERLSSELIEGFKTSRAEMLPWARFLHDAGYNALLLDLRGAGQSGGGTIGLGATEPRDVVAAVQTAGEAFRSDHVAVLGISLGAGVAILAAADDSRIAAVVADSAWTDQDFQLARLGVIDVGPVPLPLPPLGPIALNAMVGADVARARPLEAIARIAPRPILLIHSADDDNATTPVEGARRLFAAAGEPKELWIVPRGGHVGAINAFPDEYRARVLAFLRDALG